MILREFLRAKISGARVTELKLHYEGSITLDEDLLQAADIREGEKVEVLNLNNGVRFQTYVIKGPKGSGNVCLNGPAARLGYTQDPLIILSYALVGEESIKTVKTRFVYLDESNKIKNTHLR